jgi:twitching motility protein PilT
MVLVTGVTGSGKSSTMAAPSTTSTRARPPHPHAREPDRVPLHRDNQSSITQREVGSDTTDFKMGLRAALRQDPDVI